MLITFTAYFCGMSDGFFAKNIMIHKPINCFQKVFQYNTNELSSYRISDVTSKFLEEAKECESVKSSLVNRKIDYTSIYIYTDNTLLGLQKNHLLSDVFTYFSCNSLELAYICVMGGASFHCEGYRFVVHPNEDIHKFHPHVHVIRDSDETRYSLDTLSRFPSDKFSRTFQRDEKKIILPYLRKNQSKLKKYWDYYINGYLPPFEDEKGKQYYFES